MTETQALAALLHDEMIACKWVGSETDGGWEPDPALCGRHLNDAERLIASGAHVGDEGLREAAGEFIEDHDSDEHSDATWPCDGQCVQARALRAALAPKEPKP